MNVPLWAAELADLFWDRAGCTEPFPRSLRKPLARGWTVNVIGLPDLRLEHVRAWLADNQCPLVCALTDRRLRACLLARRGWGYVFLDETDPEDERRLSLAHEVAHYLRHYWQPREKVRRGLGESGLAVLDGERPPTAAERIHGLLRDLPIGVHVHLMARDPEVALAEEEADRLAYELLAPADEVLLRLDRAPLVELLRNEFGLPAEHARRYAELLSPAPAMDPLLHRLGGA